MKTVDRSRNMFAQKPVIWLQALRAKPEVNASWMGDFIRYYDDVDVSVAVQTPNGLMVPIVKHADELGLLEISAQVKSLAKKVRLFVDRTNALWPQESKPAESVVHRPQRVSRWPCFAAFGSSSGCALLDIACCRLACHSSMLWWQ